MSDESIWNPDEDPRYQRMEAVNKLMGDLSLPFSSLEDFDELLSQSSMLSCLHNMMTLHSTSMIYNLLEAMRQVLPPAYHDQVVRRYRILLAQTLQQQEQIRAENMDREHQRFNEQWKDGESTEWKPEDDEEAED